MTKNWHNIREEQPLQGESVLIFEEIGNDWTTDIAYYCDGSFYCLEYDPHTGVLRKTYINEPVKYWAKYIIPDPEGEIA